MSYVLPLRRWEAEADDDLAAYLIWLAVDFKAEVIVVDGSAEPVFAHHRSTWGEFVTHIPVAPELYGGNGKVGGVVTGVHAAAWEHIVIADDDVRYDADALRAIVRLLGDADLVRPQNYFDPLTFTARIDTARTLINRALHHDYPGTLAVRRSSFLAIGGYDRHVLFENLELIRTIKAAGGRVVNVRSLYVRRRPAPLHHFADQRVRQAYESFAQPVRLIIELALLPAAVFAVCARRLAWIPWAAAIAAGLAERGRRRDGGRRVFPVSSSLWAPLWVVERAVCAWLAVWLRLARGGIPYAGTTIIHAATSPRALRQRCAPERDRLDGARLAVDERSNGGTVND